MGVKQEDQTCNDSVHRQAGTRPLTSIVQEQQLWFIRHRLRRDNEDVVTRYALYHPNHGKRSRGRLQVPYTKYIERLLLPAINILPTEEEIRSSAQDRRGWRNLVAAACCFDPPCWKKRIDYKNEEKFS